MVGLADGGRTVGSARVEDVGICGMPAGLRGTLAEIVRLEGALDSAPSLEDRARCQACIAWYLVERDPCRAAAMARTVIAAVEHGPDPAAPGPTVVLARARLSLAAAECLFGNTATARRLIEQAHAGFTACDDRRGLGDCFLQWAELEAEDGTSAGRLALLAQARAAFVEADFPSGVIEADAWTGQSLCTLGQHERADELLQQTLTAAEGQQDTHGIALVRYGLGRIALDASQFSDAIREFMLGLDYVVAESFLFLERFYANAVSVAYINVSDLVNAAVWSQRAYAVCRRMNSQIGMASELTRLGEIHLRRQEFAVAQGYLDDAYEILRQYPVNRSLGLNREMAGDLFLTMGDANRAVACFEQCRDVARCLEQPDLTIESLRGLAVALALQGHAVQARQCASEGLAVARRVQDKYREIKALRALAEVERHDREATADRIDDEPAPVWYLKQAIAVGERIDGYIVPHELLESLAVAQEAEGDCASALATLRRAHDSWRQTINRESEARLRGLSMQFQADRARAEIDHHRALAEAEQRRAQALEETTRILERLGDIGQLITANLDVGAVATAVYNQTAAMLDASVFGIGLLRQDRALVDFVFLVEGGCQRAPVIIPLDHAAEPAARAVREQREIIVTEREAAARTLLLPTTPVVLPRTSVFRPLEVSGQVLGVMTVQSGRPSAYGPREMQILRTLAAYGAIALANAEAYSRLDETLATLRSAQSRLVQQEKLASLGQLVAGVAHEINTPLGVAVTTASQMAEDLTGLQRRYEVKRMRRDDLEYYLGRTAEGHRLLESNLGRAAGLVESFKQVAVDQASEQRRQLGIAEYLADVVTSLSPELRKRQVKIEVSCPPGLMVLTFPGALSQILTNLIMNSLIHAFDGKAMPKIWVTVSCGVDEWCIAYRDNGCGMPDEVSKRAFEPFFTTRRRAGGTGLGLHIVHNIVTGMLNGRISLETAPQAGVVFTLLIPLQER